MGVAELLLDGRAGTAEFDDAVDAADDADVTAVLALTEHPDAEVRRVVVSTLPLLAQGDEPTEDMVAAAMRLTRDVATPVRDWACFALAQQWRDVDTPALRACLAARLDDEDHDTRSEALVGLAYRRDARALPRVQAALSRADGSVWRLEMVAAGALGDTRLHVLVLQHQDGWDTEDAARTAVAVGRLTDPAGPGTDLLDGVAELYRRRAHGLPDGDALAAWHLMGVMLDIAPHRAAEFLDAVLARVSDDGAALRAVTERSALAQIAADVRGGHPAPRA